MPRFQRLPAEMVARVRAALATGQSGRSVALHLGVSVSSVLRIRRASLAPQSATPPAPTTPPVVECRTCRARVTAIDERGDCLACRLIREPAPPSSSPPPPVS